ncbi:MAG TPA: phosphoribosylanthranilate isomerase [Thermoanaerobaculia bacterium]|jgi:phosphoribosylanthranilate isomerase|nr:phosphoribosylanthranilate isomerase [Thermoanaerobaculia bacterium]
MKVKVCGVTSPEDAALACELGADLIGINFWPRSPRAVSLELARAVADAARGRALVVGVFVNEAPAKIAAAVETVGLDLVQLHGDEEPELLRSLAREGVAPGKTIRAFRVGAGFDAAAEMQAWDACWGFLFDASRPGMYGGTGEAWPWRRVGDAIAGGSGRAQRRILVAGGIAPGRLHSLLASAGDWRPWGIDVCSGVERLPGRKDPAKLRALFEEIRHVEAPTPA